jgi:hypothetical protein
MPTTESPTAAPGSAWGHPPPRTYFIGGHRVEHVSSAQGTSSWICDCAEYTGRKQHGGEHWCQHAERVAATAELDRLLRTPSLFVPAKSY